MPNQNPRKPFPAWRIINGVKNASDGDLEASADSCEHWSWYFGELVAFGLVAEVILGVLHPSYDSVWSRWGSTLANALIFIGVAGEVQFSRMGFRRDHEIKRRSDEKVAEVTTQAAEAEARASEANQKAQKAILELARLKAPRFIEPEQIDLIAATLSKYSGMQFDLAISVPDPEIYAILALIEFALQKAGWQETDWNGPGQIEQRPNGRSLAVGRWLVIGNVNIGIDLELRAEPSTQATIWESLTAQAATALTGALQAAGIEARVVFVANTIINPAVIHVMIGRKM